MQHSNALSDNLTQHTPVPCREEQSEHVNQICNIYIQLNHFLPVYSTRDRRLVFLTLRLEIIMEWEHKGSSA